jgi:hypothetical protein
MGRFRKTTAAGVILYRLLTATDAAAVVQAGAKMINAGSFIFSAQEACRR